MSSLHSSQDIDNLLQESLEEFIAIRRDIHAHPELAFNEIRTSELIANYLSQYGYSIEKNIGKTGVVASLKRGAGDQSIGIRADMDALPIQEETNVEYQSTKKGMMHACGHDGHVTIALAAAKALALKGNFNGTVRFIFQPAEEIGLGAKKMIEDGLFTQFPVDVIYGLHNWPDLPVGHFAFVKGPAMASVDFLKITIQGKGSHGAEPQNGIDPITIAAYLITSIQTIVSRNIDPKEMGIITIGAIKGGNAANVIPDNVELKLTLRAYNENIRETMKQRLQSLVTNLTASFGAEATISSNAGFAAVINSEEETEFAYQHALKIMDKAHISKDFPARTASEDFAFLLQEKKGAFLFVGNGDSAPLHSPYYNFNDQAIIPAARYWATLVETYLS